MVESDKLAGKKNEKKGQIEAIREMAKRIAVECMNIDPPQHVPTSNTESDAETEVEVFRPKTRQHK